MSTTSTTPVATGEMTDEEAGTYAQWFGVLAEPMRVRMLFAVATSRSTSVGELSARLGIGQSTTSHHVRRLADAGFVLVAKRGTTSVVSVNAACCTELPHAADVVMGALAARPGRCLEDLPTDVTVRAMRSRDWPAVRRIYAEGIATGDATFETEVPPAEQLDDKWWKGHRWVAVVDGKVAGWAALSAVSGRDCYAGVVETSVYVGEGWRGRGVGKALIHRQVAAADAGDLWTLQTSIFPENRGSLWLHHSAGFRTLGVRERIAQHHGVWRDTVFLERRRDDR